MPEPPNSESKSATGQPGKAECPHCGELNEFRANLVMRSIKCAKCGRLFAPGYRRIGGDYVPSPEPSIGTNLTAAVSLVLGLFFYFLQVLHISMATGTARTIVTVSLLPCGLLAILIGAAGLFHARDEGGKGLGLSIAGILLGTIGLLSMVIWYLGFQ
jgi:amino acid transporter